MPYETREQLPESVQDALPVGAQRIYQEAFNSAYENYADPDDRQGDASREKTAHKVAWSAVKQRYEKRGGRWRKRSS